MQDNAFNQSGMPTQIIYEIRTLSVTENCKKITVSFLSITKCKFKKYHEVKKLIAFVILELVALRDRLVVVFIQRLFENFSIYRAVTQREGERKEENIMDRSRIEDTKNKKEKSNNFYPVPAASTAGPCHTNISLLLQFYIHVQTEWQLCRP